MSGYLQRLATSMRQPGGSVHPVLAPIFSSPASTPGAEGSPEEIAESAAGRPAPLVSRAPRAAGPLEPPALSPAESLSDAEPPRAIPHPSSAKTIRTPAPSSAGPIDSDTRPEPTRLFTPLVRPEPIERLALRVPEPQAEIGERRVAARSHEREEENTGSAIPRAARAESLAPAADASLSARPPHSTREENPLAAARIAPQQSEAAEPAQTLVPAPFLPLLSEPRTTGIQPAALALPPRPAAAPRPGLRPDPRRYAHAWPAQREPDEIQIHIGRIEVTAAPQAAARPAPRPAARNTLTLADYLKHRHGRPS